MAHGFTKRQLESLDEFFNTVVFNPLQNRLILPSALPSAPPTSAPPSALQLCTSAAPSEPPHQQLIPAPVATRSYPPTPSVESIQEVEHKQIPLRNIGPMKKKLGASKMPASRLPFDEICIGWPTKFGGSNMLFSRDENPDAWYTTMLNTHAKAQQTRALPIRA